MKIEIILPDEAVSGTMTFLSAENGKGFLTNVVLNDLEDGNLYDIISGAKTNLKQAGGYEPDIRADGSVLIRPKM